MTPSEFIRGAYSFAKARLRPTAPEALAQARYDICRMNACGHHQTHPIDKCLACGCFLPEKTLLIEQHCPVGQW